ncbi:MAG: DUF2490 domain-containing protein [Acidobacteria bacterium]|jgi:hypothetical protein|nr:DUF2490 domain-containing protein [Acidobacteriota bacterium]
MKIRILFISTIIFLSATFAFAQTSPLPSAFRLWNEVQLILPIADGKDAKGKRIDKVSATFSGVLRVGRRNLDFLDNRLGASLDFRVNRHLSLLVGAVYRKDELVENRRRFETRLNFGATFFTTWRGFNIRDRNMFEHRFRNSRTDLNVYRHRIQISRPLKIGGKEIFTPFISEEGNLDLRSRKWLLNDFFAGITRIINRKTSIDLAYVRSDIQPTNVNGLSVGLKIRLK